MRGLEQAVHAALVLLSLFLFPRGRSCPSAGQQGGGGEVAVEAQGMAWQAGLAEPGWLAGRALDFWTRPVNPIESLRVCRRSWRLEPSYVSIVGGRDPGRAGIRRQRIWREGAARLCGTAGACGQWAPAAWKREHRGKFARDFSA